MITDISYIIKNFGEDLTIESNQLDALGFRSGSTTKKVFGVVEVSTILDSISPGSAKLYTNSKVSIGDKVNFYGDVFEVIQVYGHAEYGMRKIAE